MAVLELFQNQTHTFYWSIKDQNGDPFNLTGATVTVKSTKGDGTAGSWTPIVDDAANGRISYKASGTDLDVRGRWHAWPYTTKSGDAWPGTAIVFDVKEEGKD